MTGSRAIICHLTITVSVGLFAAPVAGQPPAGEDARLRGQSDQTYKRLVEAREKLTSGKPVEATNDLIRILDEAGDDLVGPSTGTHFRPARQIVQHLLASLPPDQLRIYRDRVDSPARKLLDQGRERHDPRPLEELLDRYFASRPAEEALLLLGELSFERGAFRAAEGYWSRLLPGTSPDSDPPFPDPNVHPATVRSKIILARIFQDDRPRAQAALTELRNEAPKAAGRLAGTDGLFVDTLQALIDRPPLLRGDPSGDGNWTSFAATPARAGRVTGRLPTHWPARPTWRESIPKDRQQDRTVMPRIAPERAVAFHPVVLGGVAYVADPVRVFGFDLLTGRKRFEYDIRRDLAADRRLPDIVSTLPLRVDADFTLSAGGGRLFARLGVTTMAPPLADGSGPAARPASFLVGFAPPARTPIDSPPLVEKWKLAPPAGEGTASWEGAPVWSEGLLYAAFARFNNQRVIHYIACYTDPPGEPLWVSEVADSPPPSIDARHRQELLTLVGNRLVFCTHTGLVTAVDARTGKLEWAFRYPRITRRPGERSHRDLSPPLSDSGRIFIAPADADRVFALDAMTGRPQWESVVFPVNQLLGVSRGKLICTVAGPNRGIRGLSVTTGSDRVPDGWAVHDDPQLGSYGRGLVSDEAIFWPSQARLFMLSPDDGMPLPRPQLYGPHGNLAYADGVLLVATPTEIWGYVSPRREIEVRATEAEARPEDQRSAERLAIAYVDAGLAGKAEKVLDRSGQTTTGVRIRSELLADQAERAIRNSPPELARELLKRSVQDQFPRSWRARAVARLLSLEPPGGGASSADRFRRDLELPHDLEGELVIRQTGAPVTLGRLIDFHFRAPHASPAQHENSKPTPQTAAPQKTPHQLQPPLLVSHETLFPSTGFGPLLPFDRNSVLPGLAPGTGGEARLLVTDGRRVLAYPERRGEPAWSTPLPDGLVVTHATTFGELIVAAGPRGAIGLRQADGRVLWSFLLPDSDPVPGPSPRPVPRFSDTQPLPPGLADFVLAGRLLVTRLGENHLLALDAGTGRSEWILNADGRSHYVPYPYEPGPRFSPRIFADEHTVVAQVSSGERWVVSPRGEVVHTTRTAQTPWESPPVRVGPFILTPDGPGLVRTMELGAGRPGDRMMTRTVWEHRVAGEASLTGRPPAICNQGTDILVAVSRNHGIELDRLASDGGARIWSGQPVLIPEDRVDLTAIGTNEKLFFVPAGNWIYAIRSADGETAWTAEVPPGEGWRILAGRTTLLAFPTLPAPVDPPGRVLMRSVLSFMNCPEPGRLPGLALGVYDAWATRTVPVVLLDADSGKVRHRLDLPAGPLVAAHVDAETAVVVTAGRAYWLNTP